jgi:drug/metabolite transporter (DMT)-like permease
MQKITKFNIYALNTYRGAYQTFFILILAEHNNKSVFIKSKNDQPTMYLRIAIVSANMIYYSFIINIAPISTINIINNTAPIFVFVLNSLLYGEPFTMNILKGIIISFTGVIVVVKMRNHVESVFKYSEGV